MPYPNKELNLKLFQVTSPEGNKSYFFGTCHLLPSNKGSKIFQYISSILEQAEIIAIEHDPIPQSKKNPQPFNQTIEAYLGKEVYDAFLKLSPKDKDLLFRIIQKENISLELFMQDFPWLLFPIKSLRLEYCLDEEILNVAKERLAFLDSLEGIEALLKKIEPALRTAYYKEIITSCFNPDDRFQENQELQKIVELQDAYLYKTMDDFEDFLTKQDQIAISKYSNPILIKADKAFQEALIEQRNTTMLNSFFHFPKDKTVFIAVGAAHLPGMFKILKDKNYTIEQIDCKGEAEIKCQPVQASASLPLSSNNHFSFWSPEQPPEQEQEEKLNFN